MPANSVSGASSMLACRWPPSYLSADRGEISGVSPLIKPPGLLDQSSTLRTSFNLNHLLKGPVSNIVTCEFKASTYKFGRDAI